LRRVGLVAAGVLVAVAGLIALAVAFNARDDPEVASAPTGPGELQPDRGSGHDAAANVTDEFPTSGPHREEPVTRDRRRLTDDQILHALELGNVVILYDGPAPTQVQEEVAGPFDAEVARAGQAVIPPAGTAPDRLPRSRGGTSTAPPIRAIRSCANSPRLGWAAAWEHDVHGPHPTAPSGPRADRQPRR
jgi:hypothetical protein